MPLIEPNPRHIVYFPKRKSHKVFKEAVELSFWSREEYKHVDVQPFNVRLQFGTNTNSDPKMNLAAKTKDNLRCNVEARFVLCPLMDDDSLGKSTEGFPASRKPKAVVNGTFFEQRLRVDFQSIVEKCFGDVSYLTLLTETHSERDLEDRIGKEAASKAHDVGFDLLRHRVDVELVEPSPESLTKELANKWFAHLTHKADLEEINLSVSDEAKLTRQKRERETAEQERVNQEAILQIENQKEIDRRNALEKRNEELDKLDMKAQQREKAVHEEKAKILAEIRKIDEEAQQQAAKAESDLRLLKIELKRIEDAQHHEADAAAEKQGKDLDELRLERTAVEGKISEATSARAEMTGKAEAEVERLKKLAADAALLESRTLLLKALPDILRAAFSPAEKLTDVRCLYVGQAASSTNESPASHASMDGFGSVLASMSSLPMLREVLRFIDGWSIPVRSVGTAVPPQSTQDSQTSSARAA